MANKLWLILMAVSAMTSFSSQIDLSGMMGLGFGGTKEDLTKTTTTQAPNYNNNNNNNFNNNPLQKPIFNKPIDNVFGGKPTFQFDKDKFEKEKFDKLENKFQKNKTNNDNYRQQYSQQQQPQQPSSNYSVVNVAAPVENPIYSTYNSGITPPTLDDGSYVQIPTNYGSNQYINTQYRTGQSSGLQHRPANIQSYGNKNNFTGFNVYRQLYGYNQGNRNNYGNRPNSRLNYGQSPIRYGQQPNNYQSPTPYRGNAPIYSGNYGYNPNEHQISSPVYDTGYHEQQSYFAPDQSYHAPQQSYHSPEQNYHVHEQNYDQSYSSGYSPQPIDLSQYISPMPYTELSEYMSPAQYNDYTERLYSTYNVPFPSHRTYDNYSSNNYSTNYNKEFQMVVAVVVLNPQTNYNNNPGSYGSQGSYQGSQNSYQGSQNSYQDSQNSYGGSGQNYQATEPFKENFGQGKFDKKIGFGSQQGGGVKGTLFISEINPYVCLVSGVVTGLNAYGKFGIAVHRFGDLSNGCLSIGEHYNPTHKNHGNLNHIQSHVGDLGNIGADANGIAFVNKISKNQFSINNRNPVAGRAIGICQNQDDLGQGGNVESLKNGNCGPIQACGIIGLANTGTYDTKHY